MNRQEKEQLGKEKAIKDIALIQKWNCMKEATGFRVIGNPSGGKYATERKISILNGKTKVGEVKCGYSSIEDEAYFTEIKKFFNQKF